MDLSAEQETLASVMNELRQLGPELEHRQMLWNILDDEIREVVSLCDVHMLPKGDIPFISYYSNWSWKGLAINTQRTRPRGESPLEVFPEGEGGYWKEHLKFLSRFPEYKPERFTIEQLEEVFRAAELQYQTFEGNWTLKRLKLEDELFQCSPSMQIFRRDLTAALKTLRSPFFDSPGWLFIREFWDAVIEALDRYIKATRSRDSKVLTLRERQQIRSNASNLLDQICSALEGVPAGFESNYEYLADRVSYFLAIDAVQHTPLRAHSKVSRQILVRELLLTWLDCEKRILVKCSPSISPVKHILNIVSAVDDSISERDVQRDYQSIRDDTNFPEQ